MITISNTQFKDVMRRARSRRTGASTPGPIGRGQFAITDSFGQPARPHYAVDTLTAMERRGSITAGMRQAGEGFRARFTTAQLDALSALEISRPMTGHGSSRSFGEERALRIERAREDVRCAMLAVGGLQSAGGLCLWHVVGLQRSLKEWALEQGWNGRRVSQEVASGILIAALGVLAAHLTAATRS